MGKVYTKIHRVRCELCDMELGKGAVRSMIRAAKIFPYDKVPRKDSYMRVDGALVLVTSTFIVGEIGKQLSHSHHIRIHGKNPISQVGFYIIVPVPMQTTGIWYYGDDGVEKRVKVLSYHPRLKRSERLQMEWFALEDNVLAVLCGNELKTVAAVLREYKAYTNGEKSVFGTQIPMSERDMEKIRKALKRFKVL